MPPSPDPPTHIRPGIMAGSSSSENKQQEDSNGSGTVRSGGGARKVVQWLDDHLNSQSQSSSSRHHALDERGRDPKAFNSLTSALERHKSQQLPSRSTTDANTALSDNETETKRRPSLIHYFPPRRNRSVPRINTQSLPPESRNRYSLVSPPTTSTNSPPTLPDSPVNRAEPPRPIQVPGQFIEPTERAGLPGTTNPEAFAEREAANIVRAHTTRRKGFFRGFRSGNRHSKSKTSGEPTGRDTTDNRVKIHDYAAGSGHAPTNVEHLTAGVDAPRPHDLERDADTASIQTTASTADIVPPNSGILSALLALYNSQQRANDDYDRLSSTASGASTPAFEEVPERPWVDQQSPRGRGGRYGSRRRGVSRSRSQSRETILEENDEAVDEFDEVFRKAHENAQATRRPTHVRVASSPSPAERVQSRSLMSPPLPRPLSMPSPPPDYTHSPLSQSPQQMQSPQLHDLTEPQQEAHPEPPAVTQPQRPIPHKSSLPTLSSLNPFSTQRPAQARNAGGVIGPLIASTANISGAAAPTNSRIAPDPKRPGYHLGRYSWEDRLPKFKRDKDRTKPTRRQSKSLDNADLPLGGEGGNNHSSGGASMESDSTATHLPMTAPVSAYVSPPTPPTGVEKRESASGYFSSTSGNRAKWTGVLNLRGNATREENVSSGTTSSVGEKTEKGGGSWGWSGRLTPGGYSGRNTPVGGKSGRSTPTTQNSSPRTPPALTLTPTPLSEIGEWISDAWFDKGRGEKDPERRERRERERLQRDKDRERREKERKDKKRRKKAEIFITRHVAQILQRQEFLLKLARSMMMFGAPAHRLPAQIAATARVLEIPLSCLYLPDVMIISFDDMLGSLGTSSSTASVDTGTDSPSARSTLGAPPTLSAHTSSLKLLRQTPALDLGKLKDAYDIYWKVIHDEVSVADASGGLDDLMRRKVRYGRWQSMLIGAMCSASICSLSFGGSFVDCLAVFPLGMLLVFIQSLAARNELYSNVFEITITTLFSFISAALASTNKICYSAVASSSIVLILPGFIVLSGALEVLSRNIVSGSVRMCYAVVYCLFLGFGLAMGAEAYQKITGRGVVGLADTACAYSHNDLQWWNSNVSTWWAFLTVPMFSLFLTMRNQGPLFKLEMLVTILIACTGWVTNHFVGTVFVGQADISAAVGAFVVGFIANMYGRFFSGNAFVIMITGILFQVPSGLGNNGLLVFVDQQSSGSSESYLSGFQTALQLISVAIGLTVGLGISLFLAYPIQSRRRAGGVFSL